jgi:hypothetical protein
MLLSVDLSFNTQIELTANACPRLESLRIVGQRYLRNVRGTDV